MKSQQTIKETRMVRLIDDEGLRIPCLEVNQNDSNINECIEDLLQGMKLFKGCGLAANQIGYQKQICVIDFAPLQPLILINPVITKSKGTATENEGCLSLPGMQVPVTRAKEITVKYDNRYFKPCTIKLSGFRARKVQHELDHILHGKLITDYIQKGQEVKIKI